MAADPSRRFQSAKARAASGDPLPTPSLDAVLNQREQSAQGTAGPSASSADGQQNESSLLRIEELHRYRNLLVFAQAVVEGYYSGRHKSSDFGSNAEFAEHKGYVVGDSISDVDWRVFARTRELFIRKYNEETDMAVHLIVDVSGSMNYQGAGHEKKVVRAARIAAALAYLMIRQGDKVSLTVINDRIQRHVPAGGTRRHLHELVTTLEHYTQTSRGITRLADGLQQCVPLLKKRGRIVLVSDFFDDSDALFDSLDSFVHRGFDVLLLQLLDRDEVELPDVHIAKFVDAETGEEVQVEPAEIRGAYRANMTRFQEELQSTAIEHRMRYAPLRTENPYLDAIESYLGIRENAQ